MLGMAISHQTAGSDDGYEIWATQSRRSSKHDERTTQAKWKSFKNDPARSAVTAASIIKLAKSQPGWVEPLITATTRQDRTDAGNVTILAGIVKGDLRFVPERNMWLWWDGERWNPDEYGTFATTAALEVAEIYHGEAIDIRQRAASPTLAANERQRLERAALSIERWAGQCRNKRTLDSMLNLAKADGRFTLPVNVLDRDPWLFGVDNGVVDLRTGLLREVGRDDYVTRRSPVRFNPSAKAPRWEQFITEITAAPLPVEYIAGTSEVTQASVGMYMPRQELASYMQRALGYMVTGSTAEQKMFIANGPGSNGKNILLDRIQEVGGDYCQTIPHEALMASRHDADAERPSPVAASLAGVRMAISSESRDGQRLDVALVKRHTGGGFMTARFMRENTFRFEITHKLSLMTNHLPTLDHLDDAMRGRLHIIPFDMRWNRPGHPEHDSTLPDGDKDLAEKLKAEAEGILVWLVAGAVSYNKDGLEPPAEVVRMTRIYFAGQDYLLQWLEEYEPCDPADGQSASDLFYSFKSWCQVEGHANPQPATQKAFSMKLVERGTAKKETSAGVRYGIRSKHKDEEFDDIT
jgi:putative DNA primase/helicase